MWGCSSVGRAPALQAGGQRFDPAQLHQNFIRCFQIAAKLVVVTPIWKQGCLDLFRQRVSYRLRAGRSRKDESVLMFDNEIDWVMRIERLFLVPAAARRLEG